MRWVKKKADRNCLSADPNDCLVWCLVEEPEIKKEVFIIIDKSETTEFEYQHLSVTKPTESKVDNVEVLCWEKINQEMIRKLVFALHDDTKKIGKDHQELDKLFFSGLKDYQEKHNLPVGTLDFVTLEFMGIYLS